MNAIRIGLAPPRPRKKPHFVQKTYSLGGAQYFRWDKALAASDAIKDEETTRKLALRK
jgi:hypothetical protein